MLDGPLVSSVHALRASSRPRRRTIIEGLEGLGLEGLSYMMFNLE